VPVVCRFQRLSRRVCELNAPPAPANKRDWENARSPGLLCPDGGTVRARIIIVLPATAQYWHSHAAMGLPVGALLQPAWERQACPNATAELSRALRLVVLVGLFVLGADTFPRRRSARKGKAIRSLEEKAATVRNFDGSLRR
jgi:hypothetical protein